MSRRPAVFRLRSTNYGLPTGSRFAIPSMSWLRPLLALTVVAIVAVVVHLRGVRRFRRSDAERLAAWGRPKERHADLDLVDLYHRARVGKARALSLDARTWADLDLDAVFAFLDRTESAPGRQVLYHRLRSTTHSPEGLAAFDDLVERFGSDAALRLRSQRALGPLQSTSAYWLWALALEPVGDLPPWAFVYPVFATVMLASICLIPAAPALAVVPLIGLLVGAVLRAWAGPRVVPIADSFRDMVRLLVAADRLASDRGLPGTSNAELKVRLAALARLRRFGGWLGRDASSTDLVGLLIEYLNLIFCLDANAVMLGVRELRRHQDDLHAVFETVGSLDAAIAVASARASGVSWRRPVFTSANARAVFDDLRHPLLDKPVPNSIVLGPPAGVLVTGANMTGKSTFLRTVGVNVVLAQTIHTVFASRYEAPWLAVRSCITPGDDLQAGKSYYQTEVETLVAMLNAPASDDMPRLYLFDELFRGTNTLDRIGAASAVLEYLIRNPKSPCYVLAATHDLELVALLAPGYAVVHFADRLTGDGLQFDYLLRPGPTTTRNAIALLGVLGAPPQVVTDALGRTDRLRASGKEPFAPAS